jgi:putative ABC transport system permease protein
MGETVAASTLNHRLPMQLLALFAALAVVLAGVGISGVLAYTVRQRTREIGVRLALGAAPASLVRMMMRSTLPPVLVGVAVGTAGALATSTVLRGLLFEVHAADPATYAGGVAFLLAVALVASWLPARRAAKVDPAITLRSE